MSVWHTRARARPHDAPPPAHIRPFQSLPCFNRLADPGDPNLGSITATRASTLAHTMTLTRRILTGTCGTAAAQCKEARPSQSGKQARGAKDRVCAASSHKVGLNAHRHEAQRPPSGGALGALGRARPTACRIALHQQRARSSPCPACVRGHRIHTQGPARFPENCLRRHRPRSSFANRRPTRWPVAADPNMPEPRRLEQNCQNAREAATTRTGHETVETRRHGTPTRARARIHVQCIHRRTRTHAHTHTRTHTHTWTTLKAEGRLGAQTFDSPRPR